MKNQIFQGNSRDKKPKERKGGATPSTFGHSQWLELLETYLFFLASYLQYVRESQKGTLEGPNLMSQINKT